MKPADFFANLIKVRQRIHTACQRAGRMPEEITLVAVSKKMEAARVAAAIAAGQRVFGESYLQEAEAKIPGLPPACWHCIGHLQSNKAKKAARLFDLIQTVDSEKLAARLAAARNEMGADDLDILLQVNIGEEPQKFGVPPLETPALARAVAAIKGVRLCGLMAIPPWNPDPEASRPFFRRLADLAADLAAKGVLPADEYELSMGMSHDFEVAIEEGATMIRVGTALFGPRPAG